MNHPAPLTRRELAAAITYCAIFLLELSVARYLIGCIR